MKLLNKISKIILLFSATSLVIFIIVCIVRLFLFGNEKVPNYIVMWCIMSSLSTFLGILMSLLKYTPNILNELYIWINED